jgi:hypothetical protein
MSTRIEHGGPVCSIEPDEDDDWNPDMDEDFDDDWLEPENDFWEDDDDGDFG